MGSPALAAELGGCIFSISMSSIKVGNVEAI